jgi:hypothetical protein
VETFWIASQPYFEPFLVLSRGNDSVTDSNSVSFAVYDADGQKVNNAKVECLPGTTVITPLEPFLSSCKLESGLRHASLEVLSKPSETSIQCRLHSPLGSFFSKPVLNLSEGVLGFFPFSCEEGVTNILVIINTSDSAQVIKYRWFCLDKSKEETCEVAPRSTRLIQIEGLLLESGLIENKKVLQGYVRVGGKNPGLIGAQFLTKEVGARDLPVFSVI